MSKTPLGLSAAAARQGGPARKKTPIMRYCGRCAVGFGLLGIFTIGFVFAPLGLICAIAALFRG